MTNLSTRIGQRWDVIALIVAVVAGQVAQSVLPPGVVALAIAAVLAVVIIVLRVRLGVELAAAARGRAFSLPTPESLPTRYAVTDPSGRLVNGLLAVLDLALLLLVQNTLRRPVLALADSNLPRGWVETGFVGVVVLIAVVLLVKLYSAAKPVAALLLWWGLDRVVPTAGFLGARAQVAAPHTATALGSARTPTPARVAGTPAAAVPTPFGAASSQTVPTPVGAASSQPAHQQLRAASSQPADQPLGAASSQPAGAPVGAASSQPADQQLRAASSQAADQPVGAASSQARVAAGASPQAQPDAATVMSSTNGDPEAVDRQAATVVSMQPSGQLDSEAPTEVSVERGTPKGATATPVVGSPTASVNAGPAHQTPIADQDAPTVISPHVHSGSAKEQDKPTNAGQDNVSRPTAPETADESTIVSEPRDR